MGIKKLFVLLAALGLLVTGCGSRNSSDESTDKVATEEEEFLQFCTEFPSSRECEDINCEADEMGLFDYFGGGDDFFSDSAFNNSGVGCGCRNGERPVFYRGVRRCEPEVVYEQVQQDQIYMRFVRRSNGKEKLWVAFNSTTVNQDGARFGDDNFGSTCHSNFGSRCRVEHGNSDCRGMVGADGSPVNTRCIPVDGTPYGYCDDYQ